MRLADSYNVSAYRPRAYSLAGFFIALIVLLLVRLWYLQIWRGEEYRAFSDQNRFKVVEISAPRGQILDRHGRLIADNRPRFDVVYTRGFSSDISAEFDILEQIFSWSKDEREEKEKFVRAGAPYRAALIARDVPWDELAAIEAQSLKLSGVDVQVLAVRDYLYGEAFFHVLGYTGEVNEADLRRLRQLRPEAQYRLGDQIGVFGAERLYESRLRGKDGRRFVVVDVKGRPVSRQEGSLIVEEGLVEARAGQSLRTSLDLELQLETIRAIGDQIGAAMAMKVDTGEILAMVSRPAIDPNLFTQLVTRDELQALRNQPDKPFLDRNLGEHYPPGSTFKLIMALAALHEGVIEPDTIINSPGFFRFGRRIWHEHNRAGFGKIDVREAIKKSSNVFFFNVGLELGLERMFEWSRFLGLGRRTWPGHEVYAQDQERLDQMTRMNSEQRGWIPTPAWVKRSGHTTVGAETVNAGIGQGGFLVTMTQLVRMMSAIGNGGQIFQPQLVLESLSAEGRVLNSYRAILENRVQMNEEFRQLVLDGMQAVVNETGGTALRARIPNVKVAGKTGTSQVVSLKHAERMEEEEDTRFQDHALFVALAPVEKPEIAVAVIIENGGSGGRTAAPVAKRMIQNYFMRQTAFLERKQEASRP